MKKILSLTLAAALTVSLAAPAFALEEGPFSDVPASHWAVEAIRQAQRENIIRGVGNSTFLPEEALTCAQFAVIVTQAFCWREFGRNPEEPWSPPGEGEEDWYVFYKEAAEKACLAEGTGIEDWTAPMTRYQMAQMLYNLAVNKQLAMPDGEGLEAVQAEIADWSQIPEEYRKAVSAAYAAGLLSGMGDGSFAGDGTLTRAQAAVVFAKLDQAMEAADGPMERVLDKKERSLALNWWGYGFTRYPGKLGTAYVSSQSGTPHGGSSYFDFVAQDGTERNLRDLLPEGYLYDSLYSFHVTDVQFDETGEKLSFVTQVHELTDGPSVINYGKNWGDTKIVVNVVSGEVESMEPLIPFDLTEWHVDSEPDSPLSNPAPALSIVVKNDLREMITTRPYIYSSSYPDSDMKAVVSQEGVRVVHYAACILDPEFSNSDYGKAFDALQALKLPSVTQDNFSPDNTPEQREQAGRYFQVLQNDVPVSGNLWWGQGNNHKDLEFTFDQPVELKEGDTLTIRVGLPQA